jgi:hypothetical protein
MYDCSIGASSRICLVAMTKCAIVVTAAVTISNWISDCGLVGPVCSLTVAAAFV